MSLTEFLLARIAEDEAQIHNGTAGIIALSLASRVLTECAAKRRIVEHLSGVVLDAADYQGPDYYEGIAACEETLRVLASVYADHPDYREEWKP